MGHPLVYAEPQQRAALFLIWLKGWGGLLSMSGLVGIGQPWEYHLTTEQEPTEGPRTSREPQFKMNFLPTPSLFERGKKILHI